MENEDCQSVSKNEIDASSKQDSPSEETSLKTCVLDSYDSRKLKTSLLKLKVGMPEESGGRADCEKDLQESSSSAEEKINGEVTESNKSVPKENGSSAAEEMAPLSIDVEESVEAGRAGENKKVESSLKRKLETTNLQDSSSSDEEAHSNSPVEFRGFKKRMIAKAEKSLHRQRQVSETEEDTSVAETENTRVLRSKSRMSGASDKQESGDQLTEYAQYLGLQPTVKFKCYRCGEKNFQTMAALNEHQTNCSKAATAKPLLSPQLDANTSTNFRITRKVYLCSACGTYYENWKLFLHMRDVHKRHICLYCLGMFAAADKLAEHLVLKHKLTYHSCSSPEAFLNISKGSGYLTCLTCERLFTERENFFDHECRATTVTNSSASSKVSTQARSEQPDITLNRTSQLTTAGSAKVINKSSSSAAPSNSLSKRFVSVPTLVRENWAGKPPLTSEFIDVSSFCHVDLKDAQSNSSRNPQAPSSSTVKDTIIVSDDDEEPKPIGSTQSTNTPTAQKAIQKMFPTLRRLSDLMEKKEVESDKSRTEIVNPTKEDTNLDKSKNSSSQANLKNRKPAHNELPQARKNPLRLTRSVARKSADLNSLEMKKKSGIEETNKVSSSSDNESIGMNLAEENEAISREDFSDSDSNGVIKKPKSADISISRDTGNAQKDKNLTTISNSTIVKSKHVFPPSPPLLMEVENESDNESLNEEELVGNRDVIARNPVILTSKTEEIEKTTEVNKPVIEKEVRIVLEKKRLEVNDNKTKEDDKGRQEKEVDANKKEEDIDKNKKLEKSQVEEDKDQSILCDESPTEKSVEKNSIVENVVPNGPSSSSREKSIVPYEDSEQEEESEDDQPAKEIDESSVEHDKVGDRNNVEHNTVDDKRNKERDKVDDKSNVEDDRIDDRRNVEHNTVVDDKSSEERNTVDRSNEEHNEVDDENNKENNTVDDRSNEEHNKDDDDDGSKEEHKESNDETNEEQNENNENGLTESANDSSENNNKSSNEDNKSVDSDESDRLSVALSEDSSDDENSKSENENRNDKKSNDENTGHSESESQAMTNHSEDLLNGGNNGSECEKAEETSFSFEGETLQIASKEVMAMALTLEDKMECLSAQSVIKECIRTSCTTCGYCNHAVKIGVNGKQLAAHLLAEHRYKPVKNETVEDVIDRLKHSLSELKYVWFNTDSYDSSDKSCFVPFDHTYECFQCNFVTKLLKDLISHKRKVHQKTILYCSMCKANFYSYSELLCHMCPGLYVSEDIQFRCCFCEIDRIPSAFRLMVHLRKTHHTCDVCLEIPGDQQKLSTHMWKHKLHHICYRCGIAYRNKPDITKHLFWKHGTESVLCKKCLQKKWPHVYHFCIPPTVFICEECNISFSRAVALKVHKRIHAGDYPYSCSECSKKFVSRKILDKHVQSHNEPIVQDEVDKNETASVTNRSDEKEAESESVQQTCENRESEQVDGDSKNLAADKKQEKSEEHSSKSHKKKNKKDRDKKSKPVVDVYDLPPLNLSSESDDSDDEINSTKTNDNIATATAASSNSNLSNLPVESSSEPIRDTDVSEREKHPFVEPVDESVSNVTSAIVTEPTESLNTSEDNLQSAPVVDGIWDNFHFYKAEQEKRESSDPNSKPPRLPYPLSALPEKVSTAIILGDHDYCYVPEPPLAPPPPPPTTREEHSSSMDHDYCTTSNVNRSSNTRNNSENGEQSASQSESKSPATPKKKQKSPKKSEKHNSSSSSDSSSDSDSSSCSNSNCSCCSSGSGSSSSSSSDSDSSSSEGKRGKRDRKKEKTKSKKKEDSVTAVPQVQPEEEPVVDLPVEPEEPPIRESDLDTDESSTEEDFYDQYPQRHANQMLAEKRNQLMVLATVAPVNNGISSPPSEEPPPTPISAPPVLQSSSPAPVEEPPKPSPVQRRGGRKKRRRGGGPTKTQNSTATPSSQFTYEAQPSTSFGITPPPTSQASQYSTPQQNSTARKKARPSIETDSSKRLSKRRRVPNKFYGYSSDEEEEIQQAQRASPAAVSAAKWRRVEAAPPASPPPPPQPEPVSRYHSRIQEELSAAVQQYSSEAARQPAAVSSSAGGSSSGSSASSGSESESEPDPIAPPPAVVVNQPRADKDEKLYCYCQCPYDEVSEMIACDGNDCTIEWFHFECVGIMVPPKGKWYCPDCKRRRNLI